MSNLGDLLNDIGIENAGAVGTIGDFIGALADLSGAGGAIGSLLDLLGGQSDQTRAELQAISDAIKNGFQQLNAVLKSEGIIERTTNLSNQLSPAQAVLAALKALVNQQPPLTDYERTQQIEICITALQALGTSSAWEAPFSEQVFWTDAGSNVWANKYSVPIDRGYGDQSPTADSTGAVFNYTYVLPVYLQAVYIFLAVGTSLDPKFSANYGASVLEPAVNALQTYHDKILNDGVTKLSPAPWDSSSLLPTLLDDPASAVKINPAGLSPVAATSISVPLLPSPQPVAPFVPPNWNPQELGGVSIEYGAVEKFSGCTSMGTYAVPLPIPAGPGPFHKFKLRVLKKAKDLYDLVGLYSVWTTINRLKSIAGVPLLTGPSFAVWSVRNDLFSEAQIAVPTTGIFSLRDAFNFIQNTAPIDTPVTGTLSFRKLLLY